MSLTAWLGFVIPYGIVGGGSDGTVEGIASYFPILHWTAALTWWGSGFGWIAGTVASVTELVGAILLIVGGARRSDVAVAQDVSVRVGPSSFDVTVSF